MKEIPGYRIVLHNSLSKPMLLSGVPRRFALLNGTMCAALVLGLHIFYILPLFVFLHLLMVVLTSKDPYFFEILVRCLKYKKYYKV